MKCVKMRSCVRLTEWKLISDSHKNVITDKPTLLERLKIYEKNIKVIFGLCIIFSHWLKKYIPFLKLLGKGVKKLFRPFTKKRGTWRIIN